MKKIIIPIVAFFFTIGAFAQHHGGKKMRERIKAQKTAFITNQLELTTEEAEKFWPIFNAFEEKIEHLRRNGFRKVKQALREDTLTDEEAQKALNDFLEREDQLHSAKRQLVKDLKGVLSPQKIIKLKITEEAFNKQLLDKLRKLREKREGKGN